jgi:hypothetical protein
VINEKRTNHGGVIKVAEEKNIIFHHLEDPNSSSSPLLTSKMLELSDEQKNEVKTK